VPETDKRAASAPRYADQQLRLALESFFRHGYADTPAQTASFKSAPTSVCTWLLEDAAGTGSATHNLVRGGRPQPSFSTRHRGHRRGADVLRPRAHRRIRVLGRKYTFDFYVPRHDHMRNMAPLGGAWHASSLWLPMFRFQTGSSKPPRDFNWVAGVSAQRSLALVLHRYLLPWIHCIFAVTVGTNRARATAPSALKRRPVRAASGNDGRLTTRAAAAHAERWWVATCPLLRSCTASSSRSCLESL